jgi:surface antigen
MASPMARRAFRTSLYSGTAGASLRSAAVLALAWGLGGCAVSGSMGSMFSKSSSKDEAKAYANETAYANEDVTGSVQPPRPAQVSVSTTGLPSETDLVFARMAIVEVLTRGSKQISSPWENPSSGARGTVTPIASAYAKDGLTCRDFLASYLRGHGSETWMQGEACRAKQGAWEVKSLRPWSRS